MSIESNNSSTHNNKDSTDVHFEEDQVKIQSPVKQSPKNRVDKKSFLDDTKITLSMLFSKRFRKFIPQMVWTGASMSYWSALLSPIMSNQLRLENSDIGIEEELRKCLEALIFLGLGETISGVFMGRFIDKFGSKKACFVNVLILFITIIVSLFNI